MTTGLLTRVDFHTPKKLSIQFQTTKNVSNNFIHHAILHFLKRNQ